MRNALDQLNRQCFEIVAEMELMKSKTQSYQSRTSKVINQTEVIKQKNQTLQKGIQCLQRYIQRLEQDQPQIESINLQKFCTKDENQVISDFQLKLSNLDKVQQYLDQITKQSIEQIWKKQIIYQEKRNSLQQTKGKYQKKLQKLDQRYYEQVKKYQQKKKKTSKK